MNTVRDGWRGVGLTGLMLLAVATASAQPPGGFGGGPPGGMRFRGGDPTSLLSNLMDNDFSSPI
jgi:hypothetical protein